MARVAFTNSQRAENKVKDLRRVIYNTMRENKVTQKQLAATLDISQQAFSRDLQKMSFSTWQLFQVLEELGITLKGEQ